MREVIFTKPPYMNASEQRIADMHTVLNILNILAGELSMVELSQSELSETLSGLEATLGSISRDVKDGGDIHDIMTRIRESEVGVMSFMSSVLEATPIGQVRDDVRESISNLESVYSILHKRLLELELRAEDPDLWIQIEPNAFRKNFEDVFLAIAKNSKGRYGIHFNLARKRQGDYYIDLRVERNLAGSCLWMPLRLMDVLRDLTANARKYTPAGGNVALAVYQDEAKISAVVEDSGCGIPEDELSKVVEFGYRASNVKTRPTLGCGYGLTKAVWLVTSWGGSLSIRSEVDQGTTIRISVPNRDRPVDALAWTI